MAGQIDLDRILGDLEACAELDQLQGVIERLRDAFGIDHMVYHWVDSAGDQYGCGTYSPDWVQQYLSQNYLRIDPVVIGCFQRFHPVDWKRLDWSGKAQRNFLGEAIDTGVGNQGYSVPIRGPNGQFALFTVSDRRKDEAWAKYTEQYTRDLILTAHFVNQTALRIEGGKDIQQTQSLSPRETDALTMLAMGYSRGQAADSLSISEHTLRVYIESARFKLGAMNTTHAVARAMARGLLVV